MRLNRNILSISLLVAALVYTLWFVFAGFGNHQDPLYWLYKYQTLEGGWLATGTILTGGVIVRLFGAQLLPLRLVGWLCVVGAICLPYCCLLTREQRRNNLHWLALTFLFMGYGAFQEFSPGTLSVLLLSALWVTQSPIIAGLAIAARLPNILVLLVLIPFWKKRNLWNIPITLLTAGLVYLLGYFFITPATADAAMNSHEWLSMLSKLWENGGKLIGYVLIAIAVLAVGKSSIINHQSSIINAIITGLLLVYFAAYTIKPFQWYNTDLTYLISALTLVISLYRIVISKEKFSIFNHQLSIGAMIIIIATLGTDTAWLKLFPAVLCLLPVAAVYYEPAMRRHLFIVLAIFSALVIYRMTINSVGQSNLTKATTVSSVAPYNHIFIRPAEEKRLLQYKADFDSLKSEIINQKSQILSIGQENHLMRAVTGCRAARFNEFWSNIYDSLYTAKYQQIIQNEHPVIFCAFSPQFKTKPTYKDRESRMENMLREEGYREIDRSKYKYMIYVYDQEIQ